jgi:aspartyl-tRNA(Asn)/glutamyl-tRNA(Gln) amidotransferase subunit A
MGLDILQIYKGFSEKKFSALELTKEFLAKKDKFNAFISVDKDLTLAQAKQADKMIAEGKNSVLTGVPLAVKDNILVEGMKNTCASKILENYIAPYDATCIKRLKELGAVILGKTNLDEFAMGSSTENSAFFTTKNPHDVKRVPGGSSGGSAAAVAADLCCYALGSDTGGSIRQPASFCGVVGLKPTYGAVSRYGLTAFASSFDQIGPLTKTAEDAKIVLNAISGKDPKDSTNIGFNDSIDFNIDNLRIGIPKEYFVEGMDPKVEALIKQAINKNNNIVEISLPHTKYALPAYYIITPSEASANLARFDGVRYGLSKAQKDLLNTYLKTKGVGFGDEVKRRIMIGTYALSAGYYDAYYLKAQKIRTMIKQDFDKAFLKVDVIMTPTSPFTAFKIGEKAKDPLSMYLSDIFTVSVNLAGLPAVSVPVGLVDNLPVGLQIIGKPFEDNKILEVAKLYA